MYSSSPFSLFFFYYRLETGRAPCCKKKKTGKRVLPLSIHHEKPEYKWSGTPVVSVSEFPRKWTLLEYVCNCKKGDSTNTQCIVVYTVCLCVCVCVYLNVAECWPLYMYAHEYSAMVAGWIEEEEKASCSTVTVPWNCLMNTSSRQGGVGKTARALSLATGRVWTILKSNGLDEDAHSDQPTVGVMLFRASTAELHTHTHTHKIGKERRWCHLVIVATRLCSSGPATFVRHGSSSRVTSVDCVTFWSNREWMNEWMNERTEKHTSLLVKS